MNTHLHRLRRALAALVVFGFAAAALGQVAAFTYQGRLSSGGSPANGSYDLRFRLASDPLANNYVGAPAFSNAVSVTDGLFTVVLDFGPGIFNGSNLWLEVDVRTNGGASYTVLSPLQALTPTPYAIMANSASNLLGSLPAVQLSGAIQSSQLSGSYAGAVSFNNPGNSFTGSFSGNGGGLSNVAAATFGGAGATNFWQLSGNTVAPGQFLGSLNNQPLELWVNSSRGLRFESVNDTNVGLVPNLIGGHQDNYVFPGIGASAIAGGGGPAGLSNSIASSESVIAGGYLNHIEAGNAHASAIGGGFDNVIQYAANRSVIAGGHGNRIGTNAPGSAVLGGEGNAIQTLADHSVIGGGGNNSIAGSALFTVASVIAGGLQNAIQTNSALSAIGGGFNNNVWSNSSFSTIAGGGNNFVRSNSPYATIAGGNGNSVRGGTNNVIAGGQFNLAGPSGVVDTNGNFASVGGGFENNAEGSYSTVPGGYQNWSPGQYSLAAGRQAKSVTDGAFVWADSTAADFSSTAPNQFLIRASGGVGIGTNFPSAALHVVGSAPGAIALKLANGGISVAGAGVGTSTPAFIHQATAANIVPGFIHLTLINNPLCNGDPNAILIITPNFNAGGGVYDSHPIGVFYNAPTLQWGIFNQDIAPMPTNACFNVLVIKP